MKKIALFIGSFMTFFSGFAQPTWSEDAAEVFYNNCTVCHHPEGVAPFSLLEYSTAYDYRSLIEEYVTFNIMPPWSADSSFQHYFGERIMTEYERNTIIDWANEGGLEGDPELAPPPPVYSGDKVLPGTPDLVLQMPNYMSKATALHDDYVCFAIPTGLAEDRVIKAVEIIPSNRSIVHHCLVYIDEDGSYATDTIGGNCGGPTSEPLIGGYTPGCSPTIFLQTDDFSSGMTLKAGSNLVFALHYPHGSYGEFDQTKINIYFYDEPVIGFREILAGSYLQNWDFELTANEITPVSATIESVPYDLTVMSVFPHMHLLGKSIEAYAINPDGDTLPYIRIPKWDFDWQDFYWFEYMQHMPIGSQLIGNGVYDNTVANPHNPSDPPIDVYPGLNTTDEMFLIYFHIMAYQAGDEFINVDSINTVYLNTEQANLPPSEITVYPNPFDNSIAIEYNLTENAHVSLFIYDMNGRVVNKLFRGEQTPGQQQIIWNGTNDLGVEVSKGIYNYSMLIDGKPYSGRMIKN